MAFLRDPNPARPSFIEETAGLDRTVVTDSTPIVVSETDFDSHTNVTYTYQTLKFNALDDFPKCVCVYVLLPLILSLFERQARDSQLQFTTQNRIQTKQFQGLQDRSSGYILCPPHRGLLYNYHAIQTPPRRQDRPQPRPAQFRIRPVLDVHRTRGAGVLQLPLPAHKPNPRIFILWNRPLPAQLVVCV